MNILDRSSLTKEDRNLIASNFKTLKDHAGWQQLMQIVEAYIESLEDDILNGYEDETKDQIDRKRDKLRAYKDIIHTPDIWIKDLGESIPFQSESDPYDTTETIKKKK